MTSAEALASAVRHYQSGQMQAAEQICREVLAQEPDNADALKLLGGIAYQSGQLSEATVCWQRLAALKPDFAVAHFNLSVAHAGQEKYLQSAAAARRAIELNPAWAEAHNNLGRAQRELGAIEDAIASCRRAIELKPGLAEAHHNLANALRDGGRWDEAIAGYRRAIELRPNFAMAHYHLGSAHEHCGNFQEAEACFRAALHHDPRYARGHYNLDMLLRGKLPEDDLAAQRRLLAADLPERDRMLLEFGVAQVLDGRGDYAGAAELLVSANALQLSAWQRRGRAYDSEEHHRWIERMIEICTPGFFRRYADFGHECDVPVFIVGLPRSGTTLVEQILAAHSQVFAAGELKLADETMLALAGPEGDMLDGLRCLDHDSVSRASARHLEQLRALNPSAARVVDKMPENYLYLGALAVLLPRAKFIHCRRDLRDVALSCWMTHFHEVRWANDFDHIASRFREYHRLMDHWRAVLPAPLLELDYEDVVRDVESAARRLIEFCGLDWEPRCLEFHTVARPVTTASAAQVRQPVYSSSIGKWQRYEPWLGSLFARLNMSAQS